MISITRIILYYNLIEPPSYMRSVVARNVVMRRIPVFSFETTLISRQSSFITWIIHPMLLKSDIWFLQGGDSADSCLILCGAVWFARNGTILVLKKSATFVFSSKRTLGGQRQQHIHSDVNKHVSFMSSYPRPQLPSRLLHH